MASLLDIIEPDNEAPAAVIGRPGESTAQLHARGQGYGDDQMGYTAPVYRGRRGLSTSNNSANPLMRAYQLANQQEHEAGTQERFDQRTALEMQNQALKEKDYALKMQIHQHALDDAHALNDQTAGFLTSLSKIAEDPSSPRGSLPFLNKALAIAGQYPAAINHNPRVAQMVSEYSKDHANLGGNPDMVNMLTELGQIDPKQPGMLEYVRTLPGKYIGAVGNKAVMDIFNNTQKAVVAAQMPAPLPEGTSAIRQTIKQPDGTVVVVEPDAVHQRKQDAAALKAMTSHLGMAQRTYNRALDRRQKLNDTDDKDKLDAADADVLESKSDLEEIQSAFQAKQQPKEDAAPEAKADAPPSFYTPEDFSQAAKKAKSGEVIFYKGKAYKKP